MNHMNKARVNGWRPCEDAGNDRGPASKNHGLCAPALEQWSAGRLIPIAAMLFAILLPAVVQAAAEPTVDDARLLGAVRPYLPQAVQGQPANERARRLMQGYYDSVRDWSQVLTKQFAPVPGHPDWGYYGLGGNIEDELRPIAYAVHINAFVSVAEPPSGVLEPAQRERLRREAIAALRYLTHSHVSGGGVCLNGKPWGNQWQSAMWARSAGLGAWLIWPHLDEKLKTAVARMVEFEADRFLRQKPKNSESGDTGAEENAWNAMIVSLAANMMPGHPHAGEWAQAAKLYLYNSLSCQADAENTAPGDDGRPIRAWVNTVNAHSDGTIENHGLVHVGYLKLTVGEMLDGSVHYLLAGSPVPRACFHNVDRADEILLRCMSWDAAPFCFGGNDWKLIHTQCSDIIDHAFLNLLKGDAVAAYLEETALATLRRIQQAQGGFYNERRDLEYGGFCASRLVACYLAHAIVGKTTEPASADEFNRRASGLTLLPDAKVVLHRTPTKFASFTWGPRRMALALPQDGTWVVWPHFASYLGIINDKGTAPAEAKLETLHHHLSDNSFTVTGRLVRAGGKVIQDFAYASPAGDLTVYIERIRTTEGASVKSRETGVIGHTYAFGENERTLTGRHGQTRVVGAGGGDAVSTMATDWLNIGDRIGYVVRRVNGRTNLMRYHDQEKGTGRVPILQEYVSLVGDADGAAWPGTDWACVVTFLNQPSADTAGWAERTAFSVEGDTATCRIGTETIRVDFNALETTIGESEARKAVKVFILAGQSNMAGKAVPGPLVEQLKPFPANVRLHTDHGWGPLRYGKTFGPELSFGVDIAKVWPGPIGLVKFAVDGTSLATRWDPSKGDLYAKLIARVRAATSELAAQGQKAELAGVIWMQGESDMTRREWAEAYQANFTALVKRLRADLGRKDLPFIYGHTFGVKYAYPDTVRAAQLACSRALPNMRLVDNDDLPRHPVDLIHLTEPGEIELGRRFAKAFLALHNHDDHDGDVPQALPVASRPASREE